MNTWRDIDSAPKDGTKIIILVNDADCGDDVIAVKWEDEDENGDYKWCDNFSGDYNPQWWIPFPHIPDPYKHDMVYTKDERDLLSAAVAIVGLDKTKKIVEYCKEMKGQNEK